MPAGAAVARLGRRVELDGIRGIAIVVVVATHAFNWLFPGGALGVDVFFVLSGFLITTLLVEEWGDHARIGLKDFWARRAYRLLPALLVFLPVAVLVAVAVGDTVATATSSGGAALLYSANLARIAGKGGASTLGHMWSLSIEEQFYLVWPIVMLVLLRLGASRRLVIGLVLAPIALLPLWRTFLYLHDASYTRIKLGPDTRADMLLIGCLLALLVSWRMLPDVGRVLARWLLVPAAAFLTAWFLVGDGPGALGHLAVWAYTAIGISTAVLILNAMDDRRPRFRQAMRWKPLTVVGRVSYGLYLWHMVTLVAARELLSTTNSLVVALVALPAAGVVTALSWRFIERPMLIRKQRYAASRQASPAVTIAPATEPTADAAAAALSEVAQVREVER